jgi:uncharacterized membrane protein
MLDKLLDVLIGVVIFIALFGVILTNINGFDWANVNVSGTIYDFTWAPFILVILLVVGLVYLGYKMISKK